jgi:hypothetical protein
MILFMALVITSLLMTVLGFHFKEQGFGSKTWTQTKTWLLIASCFYETTIAIRYTFENINDTLLRYLIIGDNVL